MREDKDKNFGFEESEGEELEREREGTNVAEREETAIEVRSSLISLLTPNRKDCVVKCEMRNANCDT